MTLVKQHPAYFGNLFDELFNQFPVNRAKESSALNAPAVNILETREAYHLELIAPGRNKEDFKVNVENGVLTVSFEKAAATEKQDYKTLRKEFEFAAFKRSFSLDNKINANAIQAKYENGILKLLLPKKEEVMVTPQQISVN
ncbi:MAG: hypothetical protein RLZZ28_1884 [Bacteroidota bacterium]|jgi:HSP20 family protein